LANLPLALSDYIRDVLVAIILIEFFSESLFGAFDHSYRMLRIPVMLIGASLSHVFFSRISSYKTEGKLIYPLFRKVLISLSLLSILPFLIIYFFGAPLFAFVFGAEWRFSGELSEIMAPWLMLNFIVSPLSTIPLVFDKQKAYLIIGLIGSLLQILGFVLIPVALGHQESNVVIMFHCVTWAQVFMAAVTIYFLFGIVKKHDLVISNNKEQ
jgi:O-antigen/teichoic acid export membrane protein